MLNRFIFLLLYSSSPELKTDHIDYPHTTSKVGDYTDVVLLNNTKRLKNLNLPVKPIVVFYFVLFTFL